MHLYQFIFSYTMFIYQEYIDTEAETWM